MYQQFSNNVKESITPADYFRQVEYLFGAWGDAHTKLRAFPTKKWFGPKDMRVENRQGKFMLIRRGVVTGRVIAMDGQTSDACLHKQMKRIAASTTWYRRHQAAKFLLLSTEQVAGECLVVMGKKSLTIKYNRLLMTGSEPFLKPTLKLISNSKAVIHIPRWNADTETKHLLKQIISQLVKKKPKQIVIDLRGNSGGNGNVAIEFAAHFLIKPVSFGITKRRVPGKLMAWRIHRHIVEPVTPYISASLKLLIDTGCLSSTEYFIAGLQDNGRAVTVGERTGGSSGNPVILPMKVGPHKYSIQVSTWRYIRPNGLLLEGRGIKPRVRAGGIRGIILFFQSPHLNFSVFCAIMNLS